MQNPAPNAQWALIFSLVGIGLALGGCGDGGGGSGLPAADAGLDREPGVDVEGEDGANTPDLPVGAICDPCARDSECGGAADHCVQLPGEPSGTCATACVDDLQCGDGFECLEVAEGDRQCVPASLMCVDRCAGVSCGDGEVCDNVTGACVAKLALCDVGCSDSARCGNEEDKCVTLASTGESMCSRACDLDGERACPDGYTCAELEDTSTGCLPNSLTCVERCEGVACGANMACDPWTGQCAAVLGLCDTGCLRDGLCGGVDDICIAPDNAGAESFCATACETSFDCPLDYFCAALEERELGVCVPLTLTCITDRCDGVDCGPDANCDVRTGACVTRELGLCDPCGELDSPSCGGPDDLCLGLPEPGGVICSRDCTGTDACPDGYTCSVLSNTTRKACIPAGGDCHRCDAVQCEAGWACNPLTGACVAPVEPCPEAPCEPGLLCNPDTSRCEAVGQVCSYETRFGECFSSVRRCTATRPGATGVCSQVCHDDAECPATTPQCVDLSGTNERLCIADGLGGPSTCGVISPRGVEVGRRCGDGVLTPCPAEAPECIEDVEPGVPGFCSRACDSDDACGAQATCHTIRGHDGRLCAPINCLCLTGGQVPDGEVDLLGAALDQHGLGRCSMGIDPNDISLLGADTALAPFKRDAVTSLVVQPLAGPDFAEGLRGQLSAALDDGSPLRDALVVAASQGGMTVDASPVSLSLPSGVDPLEGGIKLLVEATGETYDPTAVSGDLTAVPIALQISLGQVLAAMAEVVAARQGLADALGLDPGGLQRLFAAIPGLFVANANGGLPLDVSDAADLELLNSVDLHDLVQAGINLASIVEAQDLTPDPSYEAIDLSVPTAAGSILIGGAGDTLYAPDGPVALAVDVGGDDVYRSSVGATSAVSNPVSVLIDLGGADTYEYEVVADPNDLPVWLPSDVDGRLEPVLPRIAGDGPVSLSDRPRQGAGRLGVGLLFDLGQGADHYRSLRMSQGAGLLGVGGLLDQGGADTYEIEALGQGAGLFGLGVLVDLGGAAAEDSFRAWRGSQGFGGPGGVGLLVEAEGPSIYLAEQATGAGDVLYFSPADRAQSNMNLCQGAGAGVSPPDAQHPGRRAMAGGVGVLYDRAGDDLYAAATWAQGSGNLLGLGVLIDEVGDDQYGGRYAAQGAATAGSAGLLVEGAGDDRYNLGGLRVISSLLGSGGDLAAGVFVDKGGDDQYRVPNASGGAGAANGVGVFADLGGLDVYTAVGVSTWGYALLGPSGAGTDNPRQQVATFGLFIDAGAEVDTYTRPDLTEHPDLGNDSRWTQAGDPTLDSELGMGIDGTGATGLE